MPARQNFLIADEPMSALDVSVAVDIVSLIVSQRDEFELSILVITHDLGVAACLAGRIAVLDQNHLRNSHRTACQTRCVTHDP